jgi:hypothetical protein
MLIRYLLIIALTLLVTLACKTESPGELLVGTWKLREIANTGNSMVRTATFSKTNTVLLKTIIDGKIADTANGTYELSADNKLLTTKIDTSTFRFEITMLTKNFLELNSVDKINVTARYVRYRD